MSPTELLGRLGIELRDGEASLEDSSIGVTGFDCRLPQNEKKPPCLEPAESVSVVSTGPFSLILQPTGTTSSSTISFCCFTAVSHAVDPLAPRYSDKGLAFAIGRAFVMRTVEAICLAMLVLVN